MISFLRKHWSRYMRNIAHRTFLADTFQFDVSFLDNLMWAFVVTFLDAEVFDHWYEIIDSKLALYVRDVIRASNLSVDELLEIIGNITEEIAESAALVDQCPQESTDSPALYFPHDLYGSKDVGTESVDVTIPEH